MMSLRLATNAFADVWGVKKPGYDRASMGRAARPNQRSTPGASSPKAADAAPTSAMSSLSS
jgi:hypothetical protein